MSIPIKTVTADGISMQYFRFGKGDKTFVILPGLSVQSVMGASDMIDEAYSLLAQEFTVYVFDRRENLPASYSVFDMAEDTVKALKALGLSDIYLFGASQGGMMALAITLQHPELVKKLMLGSTAARITEAQYQTIAKWNALAKAKQRVELYLEMSKDIYPSAVFEEYKDAFCEIAESITDEELLRFSVLAEGTQGFDVRDKLSHLSCPVLAIGAKDDKVLGGGTEDIISCLAEKPDFESILYDGYGHAAFDTAPDYKEKLLAFCRK